MLSNLTSETEMTFYEGSAGRIRLDPARLLLIYEHDHSLYYGLSLLSAVDTVDNPDITLQPPMLESVTQVGDTIQVTVTAHSSIWKRKTQHYRIRPGSIECWIEVEGAGAIDRVYFSRGTLGERELASVPGFTRVFSPMPNFLEKNIFHASEYTCIGVGNDAEAVATMRGYGLHGAPLCFGFHDADEGPSLIAGILAHPGEYGFDKLEINHVNEQVRSVPDSIIGTQSLSLAYHGQQHVDHAWRSPSLLVFGSDSNWNGLETYLQRLADYGGTVPRTRPYVDWTYRPVFCTWHEQVALALKETAMPSLSLKQAESSVHIFDLCTEANCRHWLQTLLQNGLKPGAFIIDAKWQTQLGDPVVDCEKFPDLRGFIDELHAHGIRVILWYQAWARDGLPDEACLRIGDARPAVDPSAPAYREAVGRIMHRLFSADEGCYNADGIKVDGLTATPHGPGLTTQSGVSGFELARSLLELLHAGVHAVKEDGVVGTFGAFPYFADLCDMARTGDLYTVRGDPIGGNCFRTRIQRLVMPDVAIDSDGTLRFNLIHTEQAILDGTPSEAVPCLYQAEHLIQRRDFCLPQFRALTEADYAAIRGCWQEHE